MLQTPIRTSGAAMNTPATVPYGQAGGTGSPAAAAAGSPSGPVKGFGNVNGGSPTATNGGDEYCSHFTYKWLKDIDTTSPRRPTSVKIPADQLKGMGNMERQFWEIKSKFFNIVIFFKKGKFYELYDCDAVISAREFGLKMTFDSTNRGKMRMTGVPEQTFAQWSRLFIFRGYKVGRVEQMTIEEEEGSPKAKCVPRELVQILTPATVTESAMISSAQPAYVLAVTASSNPQLFADILALDASRRELLLCPCRTANELATLLNHLQPKEIVIPDQTLLTTEEAKKGFEEVEKHVRYAIAHWDSFLEVLGEDRHRQSLPTAATLLASYLAFLKVGDLYPIEKALQSHLTGGVEQEGECTLRCSPYEEHQVRDGQGAAPSPTNPISALPLLAQEARAVDNGLVLDASTIENLEILANLYDGTEAHSMYKQLCLCRTPGGKRLFRQWLLRPLSDPQLIQHRQDAVFVGLVEQDLLATVDKFLSERNHTSIARKRSRDDGPDTSSAAIALSGYDFERCLSRLADVAAVSARVSFVDPLVHYNANLELILGTIAAFQTAYSLGIELKNNFQANAPPLLLELAERMVGVAPAVARLLQLFDIERAKQTQLIIPTPGTCPEYDAAIAKKASCEKLFVGKLADYRKHYGTSALEFADIGKDLFLVEVPIQKTKLNPPPESGFTERTRTTKCVKFTVGELADEVEAYKKAEQTRGQALSAVLRQIASAFQQEHHIFFEAAQAVSYLDCLGSLCHFYRNAAVGSGSLCRPKLAMSADGKSSFLDAKEVWHPFVRSTERARNPVPNTVTLSSQQGKVLLLTGPNMGGKSTLMRTIALAVLMAQLGGAVCAETFAFFPMQRIFTRIGARDCVHRGHSTLFVELSETADILRESTDRSLCLLDELGRGTSTHDGYAIASAALHDLTHSETRKSFPLTIFSTHYHALAKEVEKNATKKREEEGSFHRPIQLGYMDFATVSRQGVQQPTTTGVVVKVENGEAAHVHDMPRREDRWMQDIIFKFRLVPGVCDRSFGCEVALKAGMPPQLVQTALRHSAWLSANTENHRHVQTVASFLQGENQ